MPVDFTLQLADVTQVESDLLLLKYARGFHGADAVVADLLVSGGAYKQRDLTPQPWEHVVVESHGLVSPKHVMFLGTPRIGEFRYREMRQFARQAAETLAELDFPVRTLTTTIHGAGYGLDAQEAMQALVLGFQQGMMAHPDGKLERITFVERKKRTAELLEATLRQIVAQPIKPTAPAKPQPPPAEKKKVFVAMPFAEGFEDVWQFGIYQPLRGLGYIVEKVDESIYAGSIVDRIIDGIKGAELIVADLTGERPNVYLEVGYAWALNKPVILIAKSDTKLHFDLSHHKCLFYRTIVKLAEELEKTVKNLSYCEDGA